MVMVFTVTLFSNSRYMALSVVVLQMLRRFVHFVCGMRSQSLSVLRYLLAIAVVFYVGLYSASLDFIHKSTCARCTHQCETLKSIQGNDNLLQSKTNTVQRMKTFLLVIVLTGPQNDKQRNAMRYTWLNVTKSSSVTRRFVVGISGLHKKTKMLLEKEQELHQDMLFLPDFMDVYNQLTKKLLEALVWINDNVDCSFVMKVDDDTFARLEIIERELKAKYHGVDNLYWGFHRGSSRVKYSGPWAETEWKLCDRYLPYALGGGYIVSMKLIQYIANISSLLVLYNSEDVSLGAWLSPIRLTRVHDTRFDTEWQSHGCRNAHIVSHKQSTQDMYNKFTTLERFGKLCIKEEFLMQSFIYSWNVPPSQCCKRKDGIP